MSDLGTRPASRSRMASCILSTCTHTQPIRGLFTTGGVPKSSMLYARRHGVDVRTDVRCKKQTEIFGHVISPGHIQNLTAVSVLSWWFGSSWGSKGRPTSPSHDCMHAPVYPHTNQPFYLRSSLVVGTLSTKPIHDRYKPTLSTLGTDTQ